MDNNNSRIVNLKKRKDLTLCFSFSHEKKYKMDRTVNTPMVRWTNLVERMKKGAIKWLK